MLCASQALQVNDSSDPQPITSAASAPGLEVLIQDGPIPEGEAPWAPITLDAEKGVYPLQLKKVFRYPMKGAALLEKLLGFSINIAIRAADSKEVVVSAVVDTAPFCLGESIVEAPLNLVPAAACPYKVCVCGGGSAACQWQLLAAATPTETKAVDAFPVPHACWTATLKPAYVAGLITTAQHARLVPGTNT
jgi:hypothetical protein